jgi:hypothetical protein
MTANFGAISIEELLPQRVACFRAISTQPEEDSIRTVKNWFTQHGLSTEGRRNFGFDVWVSAAEAAQGMRGYEEGYEIPAEVKVDGCLQERFYGGGMFAVMRIFRPFEAPFESIPAGWKHLSQWVKTHSEWKAACGLCYEELVAGEEGNDLNLYLSVERKEKA